MPENKTKATKVSVAGFIAKVPSEARRKDAKALVKLFGAATGWKPKMWGPTIVGFGAYTYTYDSGHSGTICVTGFSPRKANLVIYAMGDFPGKNELLKKLGKFKGSKACIYLNGLADVDTGVLTKIIKGTVAATKKQWPVTAG